jgi:hypothetical protein
MAVPALAGAITRTIEVTFLGIEVSVDGEAVAVGNEPFVFEGRTYLAARDFAELLGVEVRLNEMTNTLEITTGQVQFGLVSSVTTVRGHGHGQPGMVAHDMFPAPPVTPAILHTGQGEPRIVIHNIALDTAAPAPDEDEEDEDEADENGDDDDDNDDDNDNGMNFGHGRWLWELELEISMDYEHGRWSWELEFENMFSREGFPFRRIVR